MFFGTQWKPEQSHMHSQQAIIKDAHTLPRPAPPVHLKIEKSP